MNIAISDLLEESQISLESSWGGSVFLIPSLLEVYKMYENSSSKIIHSGHVAIDGVYVNCTIEPLHLTVTEFSFMGLSTVLLIIFSFLVKRSSFKRHILGGRPGLLLPMSMLDSHEHILEFTLAFLSVSEDIYEFIFDFKSQFGQQIPIMKFVIKLVMVLLLAATSYLTFAGIHNGHLVGYIFGLTLSACYSYQGIMDSVTSSWCLMGTKLIPLFLSSIVYCSIDLCLLLVFIRRIIIHLRLNGLKMRQSRLILSPERQFCKNYVKILFKEKGNYDDAKTGQINENKTLLGINKSIIRNESDYTTRQGKSHDRSLKEKIGYKLYRKIADFSIPPRLIIGISVGLFFSYRIVVDEMLDMTPTTWSFLAALNERYKITNISLKTAFRTITENVTASSIADLKNSYRHLTFVYVHLFIGCVLTGIVLGFVNSAVHSFLILRNYRLNFNRLTRRGFSTMVDLKKAPSPHGLVLGFVRFSGYQAAYILWGILVVILVTTVLLFVVVGLVLLPLFYVENSWPRRMLINYGPVLIASMVLNAIQTTVVKNFFVKEKGELMELDNRKAFIIYSHCAFFLNAMMGIFTAIKRMIVWGFSGVVCFCRIDFSSLPNYLHGCDNGYMCYIGFIYTELYHHNPILRYFVGILIESRMGDNTEQDQVEAVQNGQLNPISRSSSVYRNKWRIAYTLLNNKSLIIERKMFLKKKRT